MISFVWMALQLHSGFLAQRIAAAALCLLANLQHACIEFVQRCERLAFWETSFHPQNIPLNLFAFFQQKQDKEKYHSSTSFCCEIKKLELDATA